MRVDFTFDGSEIDGRKMYARLYALVSEACGPASVRMEPADGSPAAESFNASGWPCVRRMAERDAAVARADKAEADLLEIRRDADCTRLWMLGAESKREIVAIEMDRLREWKGVAVDEIGSLRKAVLNHRKEWRKVEDACNAGHGKTAAEVADLVVGMDTEIARLRSKTANDNERAAELIGRLAKLRRDLEEIVGTERGDTFADVVERVKTKVAAAVQQENATRAILLRVLGCSESGTTTAVLAGNVGLLIDGLWRRIDTERSIYDRDIKSAAEASSILSPLVGRSSSEPIASLAKAAAALLGAYRKKVDDCEATIDKAHASMDEAASEVGEACEILATLTGGGLSESAAVLAEKAAVLVAGLRAQHKRAREEVRHLDRLYDGVLDRDLRARRILAPLLSGSENVPLVSLAEAVAAKVAEMKAAKPAVVWVTDQACGPFRWVSAPPKPSEDDEAKTCGECKRFVASTLGDGTRGTCSSVWSDTLPSKDACGDFVAKDGAQHPKTCGGCRRYNSTGPNTGTCARFGHHVHGTGNACGNPVAKGD